MTDRYITVSSDLVIDVQESDDALSVGALRIDACYFCSECGSIVYRTDLHDSWHRKMEMNNKHLDVLYDSYDRR